ncbi:arsenate reductase (glutaredoxin) [Paraglaciecola aquimarina]|uniref:Arsenate reductase n=1 Tax=Paraglaciecola aquimarina TaxID=1235557 RepID=A0ABU3SY86_9ALTE|nr:arsenate reductase (glutaredoxin) [Paraglaciecola aquimarina]MDU0354963.1 arsenate reductase (glutaredoxin) [Paraglaciecola aquimarina]
MPNLTIIHNPRCSKSRQTLQLLQDKGFAPEIVEYLKTPLSGAQIAQIVTQLGFDSARQLLRKGEDAFKEKGLNNPQLTEQQIIQAMVEAPKLIERPIVINQDKAAIGRPPESVLDIL